ncbi:serine/threonine-protein kinase [Actinophytocola sp. NPDC049390]|uniref:serine/threonine-protein kinase n=1 Tax=Actinophytocola sp. NPDC049390 TaxID=3363894 RepID=UPI0037A1CB35
MDSIWREGRVVAGRYRLGSPVGEGAMGTVWRAFDVRLGRVVAVKQLRAAVAATADETSRARQRVFREARAAAGLTHPHAVAVYDVATDDQDQPVLVMEYVPSRSLADVLTERGALPPEDVSRIGAQIAGALATAHAAGIVHRDVKPANILLTTDSDNDNDEAAGSAKITDFGLARSSGDVTVTGTGLLAGTPAFLAPETARGEPSTPAADVFSLGATLYTAIEGTPPFGTADNPVAQLHRVAAGGAPPPRRAGALAAPIMAMLHDDPAARPTMSHVAATLAGHEPAPSPAAARSPAPTRLDLHPMTQYRAVPPPPAARARSRRRTGFAAIAALAVGLFVLLVVALSAGGDAEPDRAAPASTTPATTTTPSPSADPALLRRTVTDYYTRLADDPDQAWHLLGPALRDQGQERFEEQWKDAKDLRLVGTPTVEGDTVVAEITYTAESRGQIHETHRHGLLVDDGTALINSDEVLSTTVVRGGDKGKKDDEDKDEKHKKKEDKDDDGN